MALDLQPLSRSEKQDRAHAMLERIGLGDRLHYKPERLSGGQRQRVAIARALVHSPSLILADEPTAALDKDSARSVLDLLRGLVRDAGSTVLMVTHDTRLLDAADRLVNMVDGQIVSNVRVRVVLEVCDFLRESRLFLTHTPAELAEMAHKMALTRHAVGETILRQGDEGDRFYIVRRGTLDILREEGGVQRQVATLRRGQAFGERALIVKERRNATIVVKEEADLYSLGKEDFDAALARTASFKDQVLTGVFRRT
jgi:putative ABC transport system ATP-binding protein